MKKKIAIDDFINYKYPTNLALSPAGTMAAFAVVTANREKNCYDSCLYVYDCGKRTVRQLTNGKRERNFVWLDEENNGNIVDRMVKQYGLEQIDLAQ